MEARVAERIPAVAKGAGDHSNMSKFCRKLTRPPVGARCRVRGLTRDVENEEHWVTPSIWRGSSLKWCELDVSGRNDMRETSARRICRRRGGTKLDPYIPRSQGAFGPMVVRSNE